MSCEVEDHRDDQNSEHVAPDQDLHGQDRDQDSEAPERDGSTPPMLSEGRAKLRKWLSKNFRIEMTDGRILIGVFLCTDKDANIILGSCLEYLKNEKEGEEPRVLGLVMVPGRHIVSIQIDSPPVS